MKNGLSLRRLITSPTVLAGTLALTLGFGSISALADQERHRRPATIGRYFIFDQPGNLAGGGLLRWDCTQDAVIMAAIRVGPATDDISVNRLVGKHWVNDPDPTVPPYASWAVPDALKDVHRLFLCYDVQPVSGKPVPWPEFCDWLPRDARRPVEFDTNNDGERDILFSIEYLGGPRLCSG
jgi:hypothetical protein